MPIDNVPLFDLFTPADATAAQLLTAFNDSIDPETGEYSGELSDELSDLHYLWRGSEVTSLGTFEKMSDWNHGDGHEQGIVVKHVESGLFFMSVGTYSSWDSSDWEKWVEGKTEEFGEN